jgi:hypothetical protein
MGSDGSRLEIQHVELQQKHTAHETFENITLIHRMEQFSNNLICSNYYFTNVL